jgi:hypothetical protein
VGARTRHTLALAAGLALAGCGEAGPSDEEQVREVLSEFGRATAARDYAALCDRLLARDLVDEVQRSGLSCEAALAKGLSGVREPRLAVGRITVTGDRAQAEVRSSARGEEPSRDVVELVRGDDGDWRIASL